MARAWMPFYVGDFLADTMDLGATERGIYISLILHAWQNEGLIPLDTVKLSNITRCERRLWWRFGQGIVSRFFVPVDASTAQHKRVVTELQRCAELSSKRKDAALQKHSNRSANAVLLHTQSQSPSQKKKEDAPNGASASKVYAFEDGCIRLTEADFTKLVEAYPNLDIRAELLSMADWASKQEKWFFAVRGLLAKRNREVGIRIKTEQEEGRAAGVRG